MDSSVNDELDALGRLTDIAGGITWKPSSIFWRRFGFHHVESGTVYIDTHTLNWETAIHEFTHVLDNALEDHPLLLFSAVVPLMKRPVTWETIQSSFSLVFGR